MLLNLAEACRLSVDCDFILFFILIVLIVNSIVNQIKDQLLHIYTLFLLEGEHSLMVEKEAKRALCTKITIELVENRTNITNRTSSVVCQCINKHSNSMRTITLVSHLLVVAGILTHRILNSTLDIVLRHVLTLTCSDDSTKAWVILWFWTASFHSDSDFFT